MKNLYYLVIMTFVITSGYAANTQSQTQKRGIAAWWAKLNPLQRNKAIGGSGSAPTVVNTDSDKYYDNRPIEQHNVPKIGTANQKEIHLPEVGQGAIPQM